MKPLFFAIFLSTQALSSDITTAPLINIKAYNFCEDKINVSSLSDGTTLITFDHLIARRGDKDPFAKCRISAEIDMPAGYKISDDNFVTGNIIGNFSKEGDQIGGRLSVSIGAEKNGDLKMDPACHIDEPHQVELRTTLPATASALGGKIAVNFIIEAMLNFRLDTASTVNASLLSMTISPIKLKSIEVKP